MFADQVKCKGQDCIARFNELFEPCRSLLEIIQRANAAFNHFCAGTPCNLFFFSLPFFARKEKGEGDGSGRGMRDEGEVKGGSEERMRKERKMEERVKKIGKREKKGC